MKTHIALDSDSKDVQPAAQMLDLAVDGYESEMTAIHKADRFRKKVCVKTFAMINTPCVG
ncbi:hypothetical protein PGRAT_19560 [Paenibacillus graminis]|uniref:Uncharacterized protein n=1 Tax=Paenibacillus graminis TaxID=189425 RepID=A0A089M8K3_9BACL|nr:hypothetical protein PGRAT_19560 [Paenibacillus graminis]